MRNRVGRRRRTELFLAVTGSITLTWFLYSRELQERRSQIVFVSGAQTRPARDIFLMKPDGSGRINLTQRGAPWMFDAVLSPEGTRIAFAVLADAKKQTSAICTIKTDGSRWRYLLKSEVGTIAGLPAWSPDGSRIAFVKVQWDANAYKRHTAQLYVMDASGRNVKRVGSGMDPVWSPDGRQILCTRFLKRDANREPELWVVNADGSSETMLAENGAFGSWSPDAKTILYSAEDLEKERYQLQVMDADTRSAKVLAENAAVSAWSPDGKRIVYVADTAPMRELGPIPRGIYVVNADGSNRMLLAKGHWGVSRLQWTPDGQRIVFTDIDLGPFILPDDAAIYILDVEGKNVRKLADDAWTGEGFYGMAWAQILVTLFTYQDEERARKSRAKGGR